MGWTSTEQEEKKEKRKPKQKTNQKNTRENTTKTPNDNNNPKKTNNNTHEKNEKGQIITVLKPAEMADRMKIIMNNINTIMKKKSKKTPQGNNITEKAKGRINEKMNAIGQKGIKETA